MPARNSTFRPRSSSRCRAIPKVVAIGEAGLDYFYDKAPRDAQAQGFRTHIDAARQTGLPLVIHARDADDDMAAILARGNGEGRLPLPAALLLVRPAIWPKTGVELGGYVSFSGILTFKNSEDIRDIAADRAARPAAGRDRRALSRAAAPYRGKRNEPAYVADTARFWPRRSASRETRSPASRPTISSGCSPRCRA